MNFKVGNMVFLRNVCYGNVKITLSMIEKENKTTVKLDNGLLFLKSNGNSYGRGSAISNRFSIYEATDENMINQHIEQCYKELELKEDNEISGLLGSFELDYLTLVKIRKSIKSILEERYLVKCEKCDQIASEYITCIECDKIFCLECSEGCSKCNNNYCNECNEHIEECENCDKLVCEDCSETCEACDDVFCDECKDECLENCANCGESYCQNCLDTCEECNNVECSSCITECEECNKFYCNECIEECKNCGNFHCTNCKCSCEEECDCEGCEGCEGCICKEK